MLWQSGELAADAAATVSVHVDACDACRDKIESMSSIYARAAQMNPALLPKKRSRKQVVMAGTSTVVIAALVFLSVTEWTPEARADVLLEKAVRQQDAGLHPHRGLRVRSGADNCVISSEEVVLENASNWNICNAVAANLHDAGWSWNDLLSARSFQRWRASLHEKHDSIHKSAQSTEVSTSTSEGAIREASLQLRLEDYHPVAAWFEFADASGLTSTIEVEESAETSIPPETALSIPTPARNPIPRPQQQQPAILDAMDEAEAKVRLALHHANLDTNILLTVERSPQAVKVWGVVPTDTAKSALAASLQNIPSVELSAHTEAEQEQSHGSLPWQAFQGEGLPLASAQMQSLFANDSQGHEKFLSSIDADTRRLLGEAKTRDALLHLAAKIPSSEYAKPLHQAAAEIAAKMALDVSLIAHELEPLASISVKRRTLTFEQAQQLYTLIHEVVFLSRNQDNLSLDEAISRIQALVA